ncbi:MAG TPA: TolC family protein, partial [Flavisolibacter sp.]|nr:TolC family protein [Flavisolibacter sp.]
MKFRYGVIGLGLVLIAALAQAQSRPITLDEAIATSLQNNYDIQLSRNDSTLAALNNSYANYAFLPRLNASGSYIHNDNTQRQELASGAKRGGDVKSNNLQASLNLNWTLFDGFRMFITRKRLGELVELGELQIKAQVITTVADVMRVYYDIVRQEQQQRAIEEQMQLSEERLKIAQYKFDIGTGAKPDVLQAQIDLNAQRSALLTQQTNINNLKEQLNNLLVLPLNNQFSIADTTIPFNTTLTLDSVQTGVAAINPELLIAQQNLVLADLTLQQRRAERFPTIEFNSAYNFNRTRNQTVVNEITQPLLNQNKGLNYGITATIPLFNGFENRRLTKVAQLDIDYQRLQYERSLAQLNTNLVTNYRNYDLHKRTLALEEDNIKLVRENLFIARERYRLGISTFLEMREAQQSLADATNRLI